MDITTHKRIELTLNIEDHLFSLKMPYGVAIDEALEACGFFAAALTQMKNEKEEKLESELQLENDQEKVSIGEESS